MSMEDGGDLHYGHWFPRIQESASSLDCLENFEDELELHYPDAESSG